MALQAVLLDLDGTVWDSFPWYAALLAQEAARPRAELLEQLRDGGNLIRLLRECGVTRARFVRLCEQNAGDLPLYQGVRAGIEELVKREVPIAAVTSLSGRLAEPMLIGTGLRTHFGATVYAAKKPHPGAALEALELLGVEPGPACCFVGDLRADAECARRAGIGFAWASYGYAAAHPEPDAPALRTLDEILRL